MPTGILVAFASPASTSAEPEFNRWYDDVHVPDLLAVAGFVSARRYRLSDAQMPSFATALAAFQYTYLAVYEVEADDPQEALLRLERLAQDFENSQAMNYDTLSAMYFDLIFATDGASGPDERNTVQ